MRQVTARDFASFREQARALLAADVAPNELLFRDDGAAQPSLFEQANDASALQSTLFEAAAQPSPLEQAGSGGAHGAQHDMDSRIERASQQRAANGRGADPEQEEQARLMLPRRALERVELASCYRSEDRFALLYRVLYRLSHGEPRLLEDELDLDVLALERRARSVRHDEHRMHAFVRFRRTSIDGQERFVAWYEPEHLIVERVAPFFARRFATMCWAILTPDASVSWDGQALAFAPGAARTRAPESDELETLFRTYYRATYNPARANLRLFRHHVPASFQRGMPELTVLSELATDMATKKRGAGQGVASPNPNESAAPLVPASRKLDDLRAAAAGCLACPLGPPATQTVFGEGAKRAKLCLVGEQPGDEEDLKGQPFVGPAGKVLERALGELGIERRSIYVTNAVKHFNYRPVGKKRLHQKPEWQHIEACRPWLRAELEALHPVVILCMGATAAQSFMGRRFTVIKNRGRVFETPWADNFLVTYHPSAILRMPDKAARDDAYAAFVQDLRLAHEVSEGRTKVNLTPPQ
jgi:DNA polymerase